VTQAPYAPPEADLTRTRAAAPFFAVSQAKLAILSITTLNAYQLWWLHRNWAAIRGSGEAVSPFWRAFFGPLFGYSLFVRIDGAARPHGLRMAPWPGLCAISYVILSVLWRIPAPWSLLTYLSFVPLMPANALARRLNAQQAPDAPPVAGWWWLNVAWAVPGAVFFVLVILGTFASR
jgi:hypothetical protein